MIGCPIAVQIRYEYINSSIYSMGQRQCIDTDVSWIRKHRLPRYLTGRQNPGAKPLRSVEKIKGDDTRQLLINLHEWFPVRHSKSLLIKYWKLVHNFSPSFSLPCWIDRTRSRYVLKPSLSPLRKLLTWRSVSIGPIVRT